MTTFDDDVKTIKTAIYGKDMRPAIVDALTKSRDSINTMIGIVNALNDRVDKLPSGGGSGGGGAVDPDNPDQPTISGECSIAGYASRLANGKVTEVYVSEDAYIV